MINRGLYAHLNNRDGYGHSVEKSVLDITKYDVNKYNVVADKYDELQKFVQANSHIPNFNHLIGDVFNSLHKVKPSLKSKVTEEKGIEFEGLEQLSSNENLIQRIMDDVQYDYFNEKCSLDETLSLIGTRNYSEAVLNWLKENADEDLRNALEGNAPMPVPSGQGGQGQGNGNGQDDGQKNGSSDLDAQQQVMQDAINELLSQAQNNEDMQQSLQNKITTARDEAEDLNDKVQDIFGKNSGNASASYDEIPLSDKIELAELLRNVGSVKEIADWCGRFSFHARKKQKNKKANTTIRSSITIGSEIELITPMELLHLDDKDFEFDVLKRIAEGKFQNYSLKNRGQKAKGSLIICLDESQSMDGLERQSKGFVLALMIIAKMQKRDVVYIPFSSSVGKVRKFPKGKFKTKDLLDMATSFMNGGTDFESPLRVAQEIIANDITDGDIIFVTDGREKLKKAFRDEFLRIKKKMDFNMFSLVLCDEDERKRYSKISDEIKANQVKLKSCGEKEALVIRNKIESLYESHPLPYLSDKLEMVSDLTDEKSYEVFEI
ncbi:hypothetical protein ABD87_14845 [Lysinibacillus sphaericus]|uniref:VWA domain-containing protein n=1 Tax=Lysinibacillus sphaericus TaxID=1421 RepID=UPI0018CFA3AE|nr:VWA domain-containing protein [Lysinibacillus sphaericus]MBG9730774.1 hypothetical protein [Lysinibacillus sphaericus]